MEIRTQKLMLVFEAINDTLRETFVGATSLPLSVIERRHQEQPPAEIAHWARGQTIYYRCVESGLSAQETPTFLKGYARTATRFGWKTVVDALQ